MSHSNCPRLITKLKLLQAIRAQLSSGLASDNSLQHFRELYDLKQEGERLLFIERTVSPELAEVFIGSENFFGPEEIKKALNIEINTEDIPPILFSIAELERAKELNQFLILRVDKDSRGNPLTMKHLKELKKNKTQDTGELLYHHDWYKNENWFTNEAIPKTYWALVGRNIIEDVNYNTTFCTYLKQTEKLIKYLEEVVYSGQTLPSVYVTAIAEFKKGKSSNANLESDIDALGKLKITKLLRRLPVEVLYDLIVNLDGKEDGQRLLSNKYEGSARSLDRAYFVCLGYFNTYGLKVDADNSRNVSYSDLGACLSRNPSKIENLKN